MDVIKFSNVAEPTRLDRGEVVNGITSKMWIERYREAGEFSFTANVESGLKEKLPIGSIVSHVDTTEVMVVENHEISSDKGKATEIVITGRGFESLLDNRIVGTNRNYNVPTIPSEYLLSASQTWLQAVQLVKDHISADLLLEADNEIPYVTVMTDITGTGVSEARLVKRGTVYERLMELLQVDDLGQRFVRPGPWSPLTAGSINGALIFHRGVDRSKQIAFSHATGDIVSADYLWSNRKLKTAVLVTGRWVEVMVVGTATKYNRRVMYIDASDIDSKYNEAPLSTDLTAVTNSMQQRGLEALAAQKDIVLTKAEIAKNASNANYRVDFNVGDIISVLGDYNENAVMRVSEYVEIEDKTGRSGYPTLTMIDEGA
jgi:hypothetical protein